MALVDDFHRLDGVPAESSDARHQPPARSALGPYVLATGPAADYRLRLLHGLYGPGTRRLLRGAGLRRGMRVADVGCGVGLVTALLAQLVGPEGHVVGLDRSGAQLAQARERVASVGRHARFVEASATATGLLPGQMVLAAGFPAPAITFNQPVVARGEPKRFLELSVAEAGPAFIEAGLITAEALDRTLAAMRRLNADGTVLAIMPRMAQVWARKPAPPPPGVA
jgi:SAM-dependent methyltransferase